MTQEEKQLLLKDLCARLPYGVKFQGEDSNVYTLDAANYFALQVQDVVFKPYLRPMSSMTPEEKNTFEFFVVCNTSDTLDSISWTNIQDLSIVRDSSDFIDWLNSHHFDYRGLIEKELAIEVTVENNPY